MPEDRRAFDELCQRAVALRKSGSFDEALAIAQEAMAMSPNDVAVIRILASILRNLGRVDEAIAQLQGAAKLEPNNAQLLFALGNAMESARRYTEAAGAFEASSRIDPNWPNPRYAQGAALARIGRLSEANAVFREALATNPNDAALHSNVLFGMLYAPDATEESLRAEPQRWWKQHGENARRKPHANDRTPDRVLRVGYISPHFREHPISFFIEPIMRSRSSSVKNFWYSDVASPDATTNRLKSLVENWRDSSAMNDESLDAQIRADAIDILVDLSQHLSHNRLTLFARKPAPIQVAYLGYPYSTGLETMDYRIGDPVLDPADRADGPEKLLRLSSYFCYAPPEKSPAIATRKLDAITFGSMNQLMKINAPTMDAWSRVLLAVANSRLLIKARGTEDPLARARYIDEFKQRGIAPDRIDFSGFSPLVDAMREMSERVDIVLDTLPYPGGTTSCHLLWMGLPVVTIAGELPIHRLGASVLHNVGCPELIARDVDHFVRIATTLDHKRYRPVLRDQMRSSPLMDATRFTRDLENLYRQIWQAQISQMGCR